VLEIGEELKMAGYHHCEHCKTWHDCNKPKDVGCVGALMVLVLLIFLSPLMMVAVEVWFNATCEQWPHWAKGCEVKQSIFTGDLDRRVKKLEQQQPNPTPEALK
jgi:hypothetical protein